MHRIGGAPTHTLIHYSRVCEARRDISRRSGAPFEDPAGRNAETERTLEGISDGFHPLESKRDTSGGVDVSALRTRYFIHIARAAEVKPVLLMDNRLKKQSDRWRDGIAA